MLLFLPAAGGVRARSQSAKWKSGVLNRVEEWRASGDGSDLKHGGDVRVQRASNFGSEANAQAFVFSNYYSGATTAPDQKNFTMFSSVWKFHRLKFHRLKFHEISQW